MKKKISKLLVLAIVFSFGLVSNTANASTFSDIPYTHPHSDAISYLQSNSVVQGYDDNTFRPDNLINRVEFLKIVLEGTGVPLDISSSSGFPDIDENQWYAPYVKKAKAEGWVQGYPDGEFKPLNAINKVEALKILGEVQQWDKLALGEVPEAAYEDTYRFNWYSPYVHFAKEHELLFEETNLLNPGQEISRAYMAEMVYRSIVFNVILYKPGQTIEEKIEEVDEVETPDDFTTIKFDYFETVVLDNPIPNVFYIDEVYILEGEIVTNGNFDTIFAFLAQENGSTTDYTHLIGELSGDDFKIPLIFREPGDFQLGIIPGMQGESIILPITVLDGIPAEGETANNSQPDQLNINFQNDTTTVRWEGGTNNVFRVSFYQDTTVHSYLVRDMESLNIFYKDFKNFKEGDVKYRIYGAQASSLEPLELESNWSQSSDKTFDAVIHNFKLTLDDSINYSTIPEKLSSSSTINVSGTTGENIFAEGAVITPVGDIDYFNINTSAILLDYFGNDIIPAGSSFDFSYTPAGNGTYVLEVNGQDGSALLNVPVYIGNVIPLIPDFFDLQDPFEEAEDFELSALREELLNYINSERATHGVGSVNLKPDLNNLSQNYAEEMVEKSFFAHIDLDGGTPDTRRIEVGITTNVGENLAHAPSVFFGHQALMRSAIHRQNILNSDWDTLGLGIAMDPNGDLVIVEEFSHNPWNDADLEYFENQMLDMVNGQRSLSLTVDSTIRDVAREWSMDMVTRNFFSFESPSGVNLIDMVQSRGITAEGRAYILKEGTLESLFEKLLLDSDITLSKWRRAGLGMKQDEWSNLFLTVIYTE